MTSTYTPSFRAQILTRRTYNRPLNPEGTIFETWEQTIDRVTEHQRWLWKRANGRPLNKGQEAELAELRTLLLARKVGVAGRTLWLGGTDVAKRREASNFNPLLRSERFITDEGVKSFEDFEDGDRTTVLTHKGNWKPAVVTDAGKRQILKLNLRRGRSTTTVHSSEDHTWILLDGKRVQAAALKVGDKIHTSPNMDPYSWEFDTAATDEQFWWCYGFVYGDGTITKSNTSTRSVVRLCGEKAKYLERFTTLGFGHSFPPSTNGDPYVWTGLYAKALPQEDAELRLIQAFLMGYLAADGGKTIQRGQTTYNSIFTSSPSAAAFLRRYLPTIGLYILVEEDQNVKTNFGRRVGKKFSISTSQGNSWKIESIAAGTFENCWCLTVEDDHSFVLPTGVVTGNCSFTRVETVNDCVDVLWLLLQGCGVGFSPVTGTLSGFTKPIHNIEVVRSKRTLAEFSEGKRGREHNVETWDAETKTWTISVGDSAEAWAKSVGKLFAGKNAAEKLVLDFSEIRPAGVRLRGYGWISQGDDTIAVAYKAICALMNRRAGQLLRKMDIHDIVNWLGTILSTRRSAQISLFDYGTPEWEDFAVCKKDYWSKGQMQRGQSNNSVVFYAQPQRDELARMFDMMLAAGGSEPGMINGEAALSRAPWFSGLNPCAEILLANKGFCNLVTVDLGKFKSDPAGLHRAVYLISRANYRQTCVNLKDGILQDAWHENNQFLRLCGVSLTGMARRSDIGAYEYRILKNMAITGAYSMADELGTPRPKNVTTVKPEGTGSKCYDTTEGIHKPLAKYIFNIVAFGKHDPLVPVLRDAKYDVVPHPNGQGDWLISLPVAWEDVEFDKVGDLEVNLESAISQLDRYKVAMDNYVEQNCSITVSYDPTEVPAIIDWLMANWNHYVGVSFLLRADPTKTAADLGYQYLPQSPVSKAVYDEYVARLLPIDVESLSQQSEDSVDAGDECSTGACPVR